MSDSFKLKLNSPLTKEDWNKICDAELEHTKKITYKTPSGKEVVFIPLAELEEIKAEIDEVATERYIFCVGSVKYVNEELIKNLINVHISKLKGDRQ